jgi:hypothetical protein
VDVDIKSREYFERRDYIYKLILEEDKSKEGRKRRKSIKKYKRGIYYTLKNKNRENKSELDSSYDVMGGFLKKKKKMKKEKERLFSTLKNMSTSFSETSLNSQKSIKTYTENENGFSSLKSNKFNDDSHSIFSYYSNNIKTE